MDYNNLISRLHMHPIDVFNNTKGRQATASSFYLYGIYHMNVDMKVNCVLIFNNIKEFVEFLPAIIFYDLIDNFNSNDFSEVYRKLDYSERFNYYESILASEWDEKECKNLIADLKEFSKMEYKEFGIVNDLLKITDTQFKKCRKLNRSTNDFKKHGLTLGIQKIMYLYQFNGFKSIPAANEDVFLKFIQNWDDYIVIEHH